MIKLYLPILPNCLKSLLHIVSITYLSNLFTISQAKWLFSFGKGKYRVNHNEWDCKYDLNKYESLKVELNFMSEVYFINFLFNDKAKKETSLLDCRE